MSTSTGERLALGVFLGKHLPTEPAAPRRGGVERKRVCGELVLDLI